MRFTKEENEILNERLKVLVLEEHKTAKEILKEMGISESTLFRRLKTLGIKIPNYHNQLKFDNTVFDNIDSEEKAYWLGFIYADGNISSSKNSLTINLSAKDKEHLEKFNVFIKNTKPIREFMTKTNGKEYPTCQVIVTNKHFKERLVELGVLPSKSLILKFPSIEIFSDPELVFSFIRGYVDGDGCLTFSYNGRLQMNILGTREFLEGIMVNFPNKFTINKIKRLETNVWALRNCGENADYVTSKLYQDAKIFMNRKQERFVALVRNN